MPLVSPNRQCQSTNKLNTIRQKKTALFAISVISGKCFTDKNEKVLRGNANTVVRQTHKHTNSQEQLQYTAQLSVQCN